MRELLPYLRLLAGRRWRLTAGAGLMLATLLAGIGLLALSGWFIAATAVTAVLWAGGVRAMFDVYVPGGAIRFFALARTVARYFERLYNHDTVLRLLADLRGGVFAALSRLHPISLERLRSGILLNRLTTDIDALDNLYLRLLAPPAVALLGTVAVAVLLAVFVPLAGLIVLAGGGLLLLLATLVAARRGLTDSEQLPQQTENLRVRLIEQFQGLAELCAYGTLEHHRRILGAEESSLLDNQYRIGRQTASGNALVVLVMQLLAAGTLGLGLLAYQTAGLSAAGAVMMPLAVMALTEAYLVLPAAFTHYGSTRSAARRLTAELHRPSQQHPISSSTAVLPGRFDIRVAEVSYRYPCAENPVLEHIDLAVAAGEHVAVIAESGAGKSTLADLLAGLRRPDAGRILVHNMDMINISAVELSRQRVYLTQRSDLFEASIAENLRIANTAATDSELWQALHVVALDEWVLRLANGTETWIGESGRRISGGEGRRLTLARLLLRDPALVLLDEPLSGVDEPTALVVGARLHDWLQGRTAVYFGHAATALPPADRTLELRDGRLHSQR
ncbi:MAG: thiol reductant ABC exporter subunit CydC [Gammaproteobacteria bacterium]|nr:thiol reductant ABC exporter subunit CydC [Gammaproteobacteria bacterium]